MLLENIILQVYKLSYVYFLENRYIFNWKSNFNNYYKFSPKWEIFTNKLLYLYLFLIHLIKEREQIIKKILIISVGLLFGMNNWYKMFRGVEFEKQTDISSSLYYLWYLWRPFHYIICRTQKNQLAGGCRHDKDIFLVDLNISE